MIGFNRSRASYSFSTLANSQGRGIESLFQSLSRFLLLFHSALPRMAPEAASQDGLRGTHRIHHFRALFRCSFVEYT
jgi:hypothetical protein